MRYFLELSFDGSAYHGWQIQKNAISVQEILNEKLSILLRDKTEVTGAGRTDTGVHANQMFAHFDVDSEVEASDLHYHLNSMLPGDIAIRNVLRVRENAHARFDAKNRQYVYHIVTQKDPFLLNRAWYFPHEVNLENMNVAAEIMQTYKDFSCFSKSNTQTKTNNCEVKQAVWEKKGKELIFTIEADRFLRNMVRAIVGTLMDVGKGQMKIEEIREVIESGDRSKAGLSVPAHGLYLNKIEYPSDIFIN